MESVKAYTDREVIELDKVITDDYISISTLSTNFTRRYKRTLLDRQTLKDDIKNLDKLCSTYKVRRKGFAKVKEKIEFMYSLYKREVNEYNRIFDELCKGWENHTLHIGYRDDEYYMNHLQKLEFELQRMDYGGTAYSKYMEIVKKVENNIALILENKDYVNSVSL